MSSKTINNKPIESNADNIISVRDYYDHNIRIALLEKSVNDISETLKEIKETLIRLDNRLYGMNNKIIGLYALGFSAIVFAWIRGHGLSL